MRYNENREVEIVNFVKVNGGEFDITTRYYFGKNIIRKRTVWVDSYYIMDFPIEQCEWMHTMKTNPSFFKGEDLPVECITWYDAIHFCNKRSLDEGIKPCYKVIDGMVYCDFSSSGYRLPTEAEWEFAARGGNDSRGFVYAGGNNLDDVAWYAGNSKKATHPKGLKMPNELGLYDMCGNVFEWCWDWYAKYDCEYEKNPKGPIKGRKRVVRGNCWVNGISVSNIERRVAREPLCANHHLGIRLVRTSI